MKRYMLTCITEIHFIRIYLKGERQEIPGHTLTAVVNKRTLRFNEEESQIRERNLTKHTGRYLVVV